MTVRELRQALYEIEDQQITVKKLRDLLFEIEEQDEELTASTLMLLTKESSWTIEYEDGYKSVNKYPGTLERNVFFRMVSKAICFDDCGDYTVSDIVFRGTQYWYDGWKPGMVYTFRSEAGDEWEGCFPEWNH